MIFGLDPLIAGVLTLVAGMAAGYFIRQFVARQQINTAEARVEALLNDAKNKSQEILLEAKNKALNIHDESKKDIEVRQGQLLRIEKMLSKKEEELEHKQKDIEKAGTTLQTKEGELQQTKQELESKTSEIAKELERVSGLNIEEAKEVLFKKIEEEEKEELYQKIKTLSVKQQEELDRRAKEILTMAVQRYAQSHVADVTTTIVNLPSDELKGKIIGKEGRNIRAIEKLTGVDIIVDDTPEAIVVSGFDPVRRQIAKLAIDKLIADGRIHPARIEEMVAKAHEEIDKKIKDAGEAALFETGVGPVEPKLTFLLGRLAFRTSFGQNVLLHSIEMAHISAIMAEELGADILVAKKGALFHDIGKAVDHEIQGTHVEIGRRILKKFGVDEKVILAMQSHHEEYPYTTLESRIVQAADALSAARPGARRDTVELYLKRLENLETIANSFEGVEKSYAVQAGRELRIFVTPGRIDDLGAIKLAKDIAKRVEDEMEYPGEIKVNVIRETRAIEYAR